MRYGLLGLALTAAGVVTMSENLALDVRFAAGLTAYLVGVSLVLGERIERRAKRRPS